MAADFAPVAARLRTIIEAQAANRRASWVSPSWVSTA
jgi:hypothetical protein